MNTERGKAAADKALALVGCGYIYGATGWVCTQARIDQQAKQYPTYADTIRKYGPKWMGKRCYDCAQLTRAAAAAGGVTLPSGATSQWRADVWAEKGAIDQMPVGMPGVHLFIAGDGSKMKHTAVTVGDGTEVEARGHAYGVQRRAISAGKWTHYAIPRWADTEGSGNGGGPSGDEYGPADDHATIRKGATGAEVIEMQGLLIRAGFALPLYGADGKFGSETFAAVKRFQAAKGLGVDGICGPITWAALLGEQDDTPDDGARFIVTIPGLDAATATYLLESYPGATAAEEPI